MTISRNEVDQMANFMRVLSTVDDAPDLPETSYLTEDTTPFIPEKIDTVRRPADDNIQQMKLILERFHHAADSTVHEAKSDRNLREAMMTERTPKGSRIGAWNIEMREEGKRKFYSVVAKDGITCIASDLLLYEAAHGLVRILNNGGRLNSKEAVGLLRYEQDYASALNEAILYKHYLVEKPRDSRKPVFEARYSAAQRRAIHARDKVIEISNQS
jgi:hypothetical protein